MGQIEESPPEMSMSMSIRSWSLNMLCIIVKKQNLKKEQLQLVYIQQKSKYAKEKSEVLKRKMTSKGGNYIWRLEHICVKLVHHAKE